MITVSRHLPLLILSAIMLCAISCGTDEPRGRQNGTTPVPYDTTHRNDTTPTDTTHHGNNPADTTGHSTPGDTTHHGNSDSTTFTITINAPRDYGYMGQTMQLNAVTTRPATVTWHSSQTAIATVDASGMVCFNNTDEDGTTSITASANGVSNSITLTNRCWSGAALNGSTWITPTYLNIHAGDTIALTIVDSQFHAINDQGFNAAACQWTVSSRNADVSTTVKNISTPTATNNWQYRIAVSAEATAGTIIRVIAQHGEAASALSCNIIP